MCADESSVRIDVWRSALTAVVNRARHPQPLVESLTGEEFERLLEFDDCCLALPEADGRGIRLWRATRREREGAAAVEDAFGDSEALLVRALSDGSSRLIVGGDTRELGPDVKSALALPLSVGGVCFGLLCFASARADAYTRDDLAGLGWLADVVA
ncbi:MAG TPA: GAF domain-containing protein, partial [Pyrinomonadaceae bacterium]|nr:GAF domain-containing protein [Pyrinomonadaceae bacterium]